MSLRQELEKWIAPVRRKISGIVAKAVIDSITQGKVQSCKVILQFDEVSDGVERVGQYGLISNPAKGAQAVVLHINGNRNQPIIIAIDDPDKKPDGTDTEGASGLYNEKGTFFLLDGDTIKINLNSGGSVDINDGTILLNSDGSVDIGNGNLTVDA